jgi:iron complex outermembrane receptor protein
LATCHGYRKRPNFAGKVITDLGIAYKFTSTLSANVMVNNLLNVYPDLLQKDVVTDLGGRFKYAWK